MASPETLQSTGERGVEVSQTAHERSIEIAKSHEKSGEKSVENKSERVAEAREKTNEALMSRERSGAERHNDNRDGNPSMTHAPKKHRMASFVATMQQIQTEMSAPSRAFSKLIHNRSIEKASDVIAATVARPNAIVAGSTAAMVVTLIVFVIAKRYGYQLSGFETIGSFIVGWTTGVLYDYVKVGFAGKRS